MGAAKLGLVLDSSVLVAAERGGLKARDAIQGIRDSVGETDVVLCAVTVAELAHGVHRADSDDRRLQRRKFLDDLKSQIPVYPIGESTAEMLGRIGAELSRSGITVPFADLLIGTCGIELGYAVATRNVRDFSRIPGLEVVEL